MCGIYIFLDAFQCQFIAVRIIKLDVYVCGQAAGGICHIDIHSGMIHLRDCGFRSGNLDIGLVQCYVSDHVAGSYFTNGIALQLDPLAGLVFHAQSH